MGASDTALRLPGTDLARFPEPRFGSVSESAKIRLELRVDGWRKGPNRMAILPFNKRSTDRIVSEAARVSRERLMLFTSAVLQNRIGFAGRRPAHAMIGAHYNDLKCVLLDHPRETSLMPLKS